MIAALGFAGCDRAILPNWVGEAGEFFTACRAGVFIFVKDDRVAAPLRQRYRRDFPGKSPRGLGLRRAALAAMGKGVLICARYAKIGGHIFGCFGHAVDAKARFHLAVHKPPSDGCWL